ncbi:MAG: hypothetical protein ABFS23_03685 [Pseudomonadota bacterium]
MKKYVVTALSLALAGPIGALAQTQGGQQQRPEPAQMMMQQLDKNQDGKVDLDEFLDPNRQQFTYMDKNKDGGLDQEEISTFMQEMQQRNRERMEQMRKMRQGSSQGGDQ